MGAFFNTSESAQEKNECKQNTNCVSDNAINDTPAFEWTKDKKVTQSLEFEKWYHILANYTMKSVVVECSKEEISAIKDACDVHRDDVIDTGKTKFTPKVKHILDLFAEKIQKHIDDNQWTQGVFVRFSQRSPKDSVLKIEQEKFKEIVETNAENIYKLQKEIEKLDELKFDETEQITNCVLRGMTQAWSTALCMTNGKHAVELIINSERIFTDFCLGELLIDDYNPKLIIREFNHKIDFEYEFRTFVFKGNMTAITQYNHFIYLRKIIDHKKEIEDVIHSFWKNKIHPNMSKYDILSYVMDVALVKTKDNTFELVLIEINPFWTKAGALLFDWKKNVEIMTAIDPKEIAFRVLEEPYDTTPPKFNSSLFDLFHTLCQKMKTN